MQVEPFTQSGASHVGDRAASIGAGSSSGSRHTSRRQLLQAGTSAPGLFVRVFDGDHLPIDTSSKADRYNVSLGLYYPSVVQSAGLAAPLFALAQATTDFSLQFEGEPQRCPQATDGAQRDRLVHESRHEGSFANCAPKRSSSASSLMMVMPIDPLAWSRLEPWSAPSPASRGFEVQGVRERPGDGAGP